jgi:hypothetical protein
MFNELARTITLVHACEYIKNFHRAIMKLTSIQNIVLNRVIFYTLSIHNFNFKYYHKIKLSKQYKQHNLIPNYMEVILAKITIPENNLHQW